MENEIEKALDIREASCKDGFYIDSSGSCKKDEEDVEEVVVVEKVEIDWDVGRLSDYIKVVLEKESGQTLILKW